MKLRGGSFKGLSQYLNAKNNKLKPRIGIINFDAHFDLLKSEKNSSGTPSNKLPIIAPS